MRGDDHVARIVAEGVLQPLHRFGVEVVGRLVEQKDVRFLEQEAAQSDTTRLPAGKSAGVLVVRRQNQGIHCHVYLPVQLPAVGGIDGILQAPHFFHGLLHFVVGHGIGHAGGNFVELVDHLFDVTEGFLDRFPYRFVGIELRLLGHPPDAGAFKRFGATVVLLVLSRHDAE